MKIHGFEVYKKLKCESGVHKFTKKIFWLIIKRVIRVPDTEKLGRLHSSTASVIVLPESPLVCLNFIELN